MTINYEEAVNWIHSRLRLGIKPGLKRMEWLMEKMDHPERHLRVVHVAGTNGKGSTIACMRAILQEAGYEVGTFTSPYIEQFNERISVNGEAASDEVIAELVRIIRPLAEELEKTELGGPSEFEVITAMAFYYFAYLHPVDVLLVETGLGGRLDSTNIVHPLLSVITMLGMDHMDLLGDTLEDIAAEKAGIIKSGVPVVSGVKQKNAQRIIHDRVKEMRSSIYQLGDQFEAEWKASHGEGEVFSFNSVFASIDDLHVRLNGLHQADNAALAVMSILYLRAFYAFLVDEEHIRKGLKSVSWPGRMEKVSDQPLILLDGAHNPEGMEALVTSLNARYQDKNITALFAGMRDKQLNTMADLMKTAVDSIIFTTFDYPRAAGKEEFAILPDGCQWEEDWRKAINEFKHSAKEGDMLVVTGSLYFISEVKAYLNRS